jgi:hypothetical protein
MTTKLKRILVKTSDNNNYLSTPKCTTCGAYHTLCNHCGELKKDFIFKPCECGYSSPYTCNCINKRVHTGAQIDNNNFLMDAKNALRILGDEIQSPNKYLGSKNTTTTLPKNHDFKPSLKDYYQRKLTLISKKQNKSPHQVALELEKNNRELKIAYYENKRFYNEFSPNTKVKLELPEFSHYKEIGAPTIIKNMEVKRKRHGGGVRGGQPDLNYQGNDDKAQKAIEQLQKQLKETQEKLSKAQTKSFNDKAEIMKENIHTIDNLNEQLTKTNTELDSLKQESKNDKEIIELFKLKLDQANGDIKASEAQEALEKANKKAREESFNEIKQLQNKLIKANGKVTELEEVKKELEGVKNELEEANRKATKLEEVKKELIKAKQQVVELSETNKKVLEEANQKDTELREANKKAAELQQVKNELDEVKNELLEWNEWWDGVQQDQQAQQDQQEHELDMSGGSFDEVLGNEEDLNYELDKVSDGQAIPLEENLYENNDEDFGEYPKSKLFPIIKVEDYKISETDLNNKFTPQQMKVFQTATFIDDYSFDYEDNDDQYVNYELLGIKTWGMDEEFMIEKSELAFTPPKYIDTVDALVMYESDNKIDIDKYKDLIPIIKMYANFIKDRIIKNKLEKDIQGIAKSISDTKQSDNDLDDIIVNILIPAVLNNGGITQLVNDAVEEAKQEVTHDVGDHFEDAPDRSTIKNITHDNNSEITSDVNSSLSNYESLSDRDRNSIIDDNGEEGGMVNESDEEVGGMENDDVVDESNEETGSVNSGEEGGVKDDDVKDKQEMLDSSQKAETYSDEERQLLILLSDIDATDKDGRFIPYRDHGENYYENHWNSTQTDEGLNFVRDVLKSETKKSKKDWGKWKPSNEKEAGEAYAITIVKRDYIYTKKEDFNKDGIINKNVINTLNEKLNGTLKTDIQLQRGTQEKKTAKAILAIFRKYREVTSKEKSINDNDDNEEEGSDNVEESENANEEESVNDNVEEGENDNVEESENDNEEESENDNEEESVNDNVEEGENDNVEEGENDNVEEGENDNVEEGGGNNEKYTPPDKNEFNKWRAKDIEKMKIFLKYKNVSDEKIKELRNFTNMKQYVTKQKLVTTPTVGKNDNV